MTIKFISLATAIVMSDVYLQSQLSSGGPLFLFTSDNLAVNLILLLIVGLMVAVSFKKSFEKWWSFAGCTSLSLMLGMIGLIGSFFSNLFYAFPQTLLPLDYLFLLEAGVVFGIAALSYKHQPIPAKLRLVSRLSRAGKTALAVPENLRPPVTVRPRRTQPA